MASAAEAVTSRRPLASLNLSGKAATPSGAGGALAAFGVQHFHEFKHGISDIKGAGGEVNALQASSIQRFHEARNVLLPHAMGEAGPRFKAEMSRDFKDRKSPAGQRAEAVLEQQVGPLLMPALARARHRLTSLNDVKERSEESVNKHLTVQDLLSQQTTGRIPTAASGSANPDSDIDVNSRSLASSFFLPHVTEQLSSSLASGGAMPQGQTAGTGVDLNFYAMDYLVGSAAEHKGKPFRTEKGKAGDAHSLALTMNQEVGIGAGADFKAFERDQRKAALVHLVRHIDPSADNLEMDHAGRKDRPQHLDSLAAALMSAEDKTLLEEAWQEHLCKQQQVKAAGDTLRPTLAANFASTYGPGYTMTTKGKGHLDRALVAAAHEKLYVEAHAGEGGIGDQRAELRRRDGDLNRERGKRRRRRDHRLIARAEKRVGQQALALKAKIADGLYFANEAYASQGAVHHAVGVMQGLGAEQRLAEDVSGEKRSPTVDIPRVMMLHAVIENAGDAFRVLKDGDADGHPGDASAQGPHGLTQLKDAHKYVHRMFDATGRAGVKATNNEQSSAVRTIAAAHARVKDTESLLQKRGGSEAEGKQREGLNIDDDKNRVNEVVASRGNSVPQLDIRTFLVEHVARAMNTFQGDDSASLTVSDRQHGDASAERLKFGIAQRDLLKARQVLERPGGRSSPLHT